MDENKIKIAEIMMMELMADLDEDEKLELLFILRRNIIKKMGGKL